MRKAMRRLVLFALAAGVVGLVPTGAHAYSAVAKTIPGNNEIVRAVDPGQLNCTDASGKPNDAAANSWGPATSTIDNPCDVRIFFDQPINDDTIALGVTGPGGVITDWAKRTADLQSSNDLRRVPGPDTLILTPPASLGAGTYTVHVETDGVDDITVADGVGTGRTAQCTVTDPQTGEPRQIDLGCYDLTFVVAPTPRTPVITNAGNTDHRNFVLEGTAEPASAIEVYAGDDKIGTAVADAIGDFHVDTNLSAGATTFVVRAKAERRTTAEKIGLVRTPVVESAATTIVATVADDAAAPSVVVESQALSAGSESTAVQDALAVVFESDDADVGGRADDNDEVSEIVVTVTDALSGDVVTAEGAYTVETKLGPFATWTVHFVEVPPGQYLVTVVAKDPSGNASEATEGQMKIIVTTADALD